MNTHFVKITELTAFKFCFTMHFDSLNLIHTNQCTSSHKDVLVF